MLDRDPFPLPSPILLIATNHVGNNIFLTPAIRLLKRMHPEVRFDVVTMSPRGASVFENNPSVSRTHTVYFKRQMQQLVKNYPLVLGLHRERAAEYLRDTTARSLIIEPEQAGRHRADHALAFVCNLLDCATTDADRSYVLCPQTRHERRVDALLQAAQPGECLVGLHLGSGRTLAHGWKFWYRDRGKDARLWPLEDYIVMARLLREHHPAIRFVLTGSRSEKFLGKRFLEAFPDTLDLMGETSLLELAALMPRLGCFVTQDTGVLHVACSSEVPVVGLFGPSNPTQTGPYPLRQQHRIIKKSRTEEITPDEVVMAVLAILKSTRKPVWMQKAG